MSSRQVLTLPGAPDESGGEGPGPARARPRAPPGRRPGRFPVSAQPGRRTAGSRGEWGPGASAVSPHPAWQLRFPLHTVFLPRLKVLAPRGLSLPSCSCARAGTRTCVPPSPTSQGSPSCRTGRLYGVRSQRLPGVAGPPGSLRGSRKGCLGGPHCSPASSPCHPPCPSRGQVSARRANMFIFKVARLTA